MLRHELQLQFSTEFFEKFYYKAIPFTLTAITDWKHCGLWDGLLCYSAWEVCESLAGLARLDKNKSAIVKEQALEPILELLRSGDDQDRETAARTLWMLAFDVEGRQQIRVSWRARTKFRSTRGRGQHIQVSWRC